MNSLVKSSEERKRLFEVASMILISVLLVSLSRLEKILFQLSETLSTNKEFFTTVVYFGLININVVLILILGFLIFRNVVKLVVERRRGVIGSKLRTKLIVSLVFFAVAPTALLFYISSRYLTESFETWFSSRVESTIANTKEVTARVYNREARRMESLARIALQRIKIEPIAPFIDGELRALNPKGLEGFEVEYRLTALKLFDNFGKLVWSNEGITTEALLKDSASEFVLEAMQLFIADPQKTSHLIINVEYGKDIVKGAAPIFDPDSGVLLGIVVAEEKFETQIIRTIETILQEFSSLRPGAKLIKLSYTILLLVMVLIIAFSATWLGFYVAKGIIGPIQALAEATREVASGNYEIDLKANNDDETGHLVKSFNFMIAELRANRNQVKRFTEELEFKNIELESRRKYMEIVLQNISAGVISLDHRGVITAINDAAETLLGISAAKFVGKVFDATLDTVIFEQFWNPIQEGLAKHSTFNSQLELVGRHDNLSILVDASKFADENGEALGSVVVFANASEQVKAQRVAAWREVARRIAHEIKNPITPIKLSAQRLLRKFEGQFKGRDREIFGTCIETIISEVDNLRDLVNEFSKFSRLPTIKPRRISINDLIREVTALYSMSYPNITFDTSGLTDDIPSLNLDKEQISRVLSNLVVNAEASIRESKVEVGLIAFRTTVRPELSVVRLEVIDTGGGIADNIRSKILEPYFSTKKEGTGLGLAIVNQIVSDHGGYLRIGEPDGGRTGAVIIIDLPLSEE